MSSKVMFLTVLSSIVVTGSTDKSDTCTVPARDSWKLKGTPPWYTNKLQYPRVISKAAALSILRGAMPEAAGVNAPISLQNPEHLFTHLLFFLSKRY